MSQPQRKTKAQIIPLSSFRNAENFHLLNEVESYWEALRDGALAPHRRDIDPRGLERALDNIFYIEKLGAGVVRFRLTGLLLESLMGMDPRSMPFASLFHTDDRPTLKQTLETVLEQPNVARMRLLSLGHSGHPPLSGGMVLLPLRDDQGAITKALGCLQVSPATLPGQRAFSIRSCTMRSLAPATTRPEKMPPLVEEASKAFAENPAQFAHRSANPGQRPRLRLVKS